MTRDTTKYKSPESFDPERFLSENGELIDDDVSYHLDLAGGAFFVSDPWSRFKINIRT